jgi:uncharacterized ferritin-like protein (DUF455 family)
LHPDQSLVHHACILNEPRQSIDSLYLVDADAPPPGTFQRWAHDYIVGVALGDKLAPPPIPEHAAPEREVLRIARPGRPPELRVSVDKTKTPGAGALREPRRRAELLHTFLHHELQAAELMCWAVLAFPDTPEAFQRGLLGICRDEIRHMRMYAAHIESLGCRIGDFPVRDWFWSRVPAATSPSAFLAVMGLGFEAGNLDHTRRFAERFRSAGDERGARLQEVVAHEEIAHVAFAGHWFRHFEGELSFQRWCAALPTPLSPMVMRGDPLDREARAQAGMDKTFLDALERWQPVSRGS